MCTVSETMGPSVTSTNAKVDHVPNGKSPILYYTDENNVHAIHDLLKDENYNPNEIAELDGRTALLKASYHGQEDIVKALLQHPKIDTSFLDKSGYNGENIITMFDCQDTFPFFLWCFFLLK